MPNWINSGNSGWIWKTERERSKKQQVYLVSSSREKGCGILNGALFASRHRDKPNTPI